jgi:HEAT repeat protein
MEQPNPPPSFEQTAGYQLASTFLHNPSDDPDVLGWLLNLTHPDPSERCNAVYHFRRLRDVRVRVPLLVALRDPYASVRSAAACGLGLLHDRHATEPLLAVFQEEIARRRQAAAASGRPYYLDHDLEMIISALARLNDERAVEPLIAALRGLGWDGQGKIARSLVLLKDRRAAEPLLAALKETIVRVKQATPTPQVHRPPLLSRICSGQWGRLATGTR